MIDSQLTYTEAIRLFSELAGDLVGDCSYAISYFGIVIGGLFVAEIFVAGMLFLYSRDVKRSCAVLNDSCAVLNKKLEQFSDSESGSES